MDDPSLLRKHEMGSISSELDGMLSRRGERRYQLMMWLISDWALWFIFKGLTVGAFEVETIYCRVLSYLSDFSPVVAIRVGSSSCV